MLKRVAVALSLVALLTVGAAFSGSQSEEVITPEEFAAFFQICCRPPVITKVHLPYIRNLHGFGADSQTYDLLASNLPIDGAKLDRLCTEYPGKFTDGKCFLLRTLFNLEDHGAFDRIEVLQSQMTELCNLIDDLRDDIRDLEDELDELGDRVEQLELQDG